MNKKYLYLFVLYFAVLFTSLSTANEKSIFWEVVSPKGKIHYLFGTLHSDDNRISNFSRGVKQAMKKSDLFLSEVKESNDQGSLQIKGDIYKNYLNSKEIERVNSLADFHTMNESYVNKMKPWLLALVFNSPRPITPYNQDNLLKSMARDFGVKLSGLESHQEHFKVLDDFSIKDQIEILKKVLKLSHEDKENNYEYLMSAYLRFEPEVILKANEKITKLIVTPKIWNQIELKLLINRNKLFMERILNFSKKQNLFIAIGASHLGGETGLLNQFKKKGYKLNPIQPLN